jgi:hypothetical protein
MESRVIAALADVLARHDAEEPGYRVGDRWLMDRLLELLGWRGGTIYQALDEARRRTTPADVVPELAGGTAT